MITCIVLRILACEQYLRTKACVHCLGNPKIFINLQRTMRKTQMIFDKFKVYCKVSEDKQNFIVVIFGVLLNVRFFSHQLSKTFLLILSLNVTIRNMLKATVEGKNKLTEQGL